MDLRSSINRLVSVQSSLTPQKFVSLKKDTQLHMCLGPNPRLGDDGGHQPGEFDKYIYIYIYMCPMIYQLCL